MEQLEASDIKVGNGTVQTRARNKPRIPTNLADSGRNGLLIAAVMLFFLGLAMYKTAIDFVPGTPDDLELLTSVAHTHNPAKYLVGDFGMAPYLTGNYAHYRPLHPISLWVVYRIFGIRGFPVNQSINFVLSIINATLVLIIVWRVQRDSLLALMGASLFLVSVHTMSGAIWIADRPNLLVGLAFLLLLHHVVHVRESGKGLRIPYVLFLCLLGLLSKESGLIVPVMAIVVSIRMAGRTRWQRIRTSAIWAGVIAAYFVGRVLMFGTNAISYSTVGYLFGVRYYSLGSALPGHLPQIALIDNVVKNIVELFLPIFTEEGGFIFKFASAHVALEVTLAALAMVCLLVSAIRKRLTSLQVDCLWAVVFNAAIHNPIFRYRDLYTAQIAICVLIASSPLLHQSRRRVVAFAAACVVLFVSVLRVNDYVQENYLTRYSDLNAHNLQRVLHDYHGSRTDPKLAQQIIQTYQHKNF